MVTKPRVPVRRVRRLAESPRRNHLFTENMPTAPWAHGRAPQVQNGRGSPERTSQAENASARKPVRVTGSPGQSGAAEDVARSSRDGAPEERRRTLPEANEGGGHGRH